MHAESTTGSALSQSLLPLLTVRANAQNVETMRFRLKRSMTILMVLLVPSRSTAQEDWRPTRDLGSPEVIERYMELLDDSPANERALDGLVHQYLPHGGVDGLIEVYALRVAEEPENAAVHLILARLRAMAGQDASALPLLDRAVELGFEATSVFVLRGEVQARLGELSAAVADFEAALELATSGDEQIEILRDLGDLQLSLGNQDEALEAYQRIADAEPRDRYIRRELAGILYEAGFLREALDEYQQAVELSGSNRRDEATALLEVATLQEELARYEDAIESWEEVLSLTQTDNWMHGEAQTGLVRTYRSWGRLDVLLAELDGQLTDRTRDSFVLTNRARILEELGRHTEAEQAYELALQRRANDRNIWIEFASILAARGQSERAQTLIATALEQWPNDFELIQLTVEGYLEGGMVFDASFVLRDRQATFWNDATELWQFFQYYQQIGDISAANAVSDRLQELDPDDYRPLLRMAQSAFEEGNVESALNTVSSLAQSDDPWVIVELTELLQQHDQTLNATELIWTARGRFPESEEIALLWMRAEQTRGAQWALDAAREVLLLADSWDIVLEAFRLYNVMLETAHLEGWALEHFQDEYDQDFSNYRLGRTLLMFQILAGEVDDASRTLATLRITVPPSLSPDEWVLTTLRQWPSPSALPLLRRLGEDDLQSSWRYDLIEAQLLAEQGRIDESRTVLETIRAHSGHIPAVLDDIGAVFTSLGTPTDQTMGCFLTGLASHEEPRNEAYRLRFSDCLRTLGKVELSFQIAMAGFEMVRDTVTADALYDRLLAAPAGRTEQQIAEIIRPYLADRGSQLNDWLDEQLRSW